MVRENAAPSTLSPGGGGGGGGGEPVVVLSTRNSNREETLVNNFEVDNGHYITNGSSGIRRSRRNHSHHHVAANGSRRHHHSSGGGGGSPVPPHNQHPPGSTQLNIVWQGLPPNYQIAPDQLFILSGPAISEENCEGGYVLTAHPVPRGATVLATPAITPPILPNGGEITIRLNAASGSSRQDEEEGSAGDESALMEQQGNSGGINPHAPPFYPNNNNGASENNHMGDGDQDKENNINNLNNAARVRQPSVTVWNSYFPTGKEFPLRQTQPPVYFHQMTTAAGTAMVPDPDSSDDKECSSVNDEVSNESLGN